MDKEVHTAEDPIQAEDKEDIIRKCKICKRKLKRFTAQEDWDSRAYHKRCFDNIINDIAHYSTTAYSKYGHQKRLINGMTHLQARKQTKFIITFD